MRQSDQTDAIGAALVELGGKLDNPPKRSRAKIPTKKGGEFSYTYLNLPDLLAVLREPLHASGLAVLQGPGEGDGDGVNIYTRVVHTSGQWIESGPLFVPATPGDPKATGSAVTYGCRYALCAMLGIAGSEDDDGARAVHRGAVENPSDNSADVEPVRSQEVPAGMADADGADASKGEVPAAPAGDGGATGGSGPPVPDDEVREFRRYLADTYGTAQALMMARELFQTKARKVPNLTTLDIQELAAVDTEFKDRRSAVNPA